MNESRFEGLMATYSASLGVCARRPSGAVRPALWRRAALVAAAFAVGGISLAVLWPRNAAAASIQRIGAAIRHADSMVEEYWRRTPAGRWIMFDRISYRAGMWRYDVQKSVPLALTLIKRDGLTMTDWHQLDHASVRATEASDPDTREYRDPLDYAEESINMGGSSPRSVQVLNHAPVEGRPAYAVTLDRAADDYHAEIVVDQATDLPISATASVKDPGQTLYYRQSYLFNVPIADSQFSPDPNRPVIDLRDAERKLALAWATPIKRVGGAEVWDACVGKDGTIWIAVSPGETGGNVTLPTSITTSPRRDYARLHDIQPSWILARGHHFTMDGKAVFVAAFTPLVPNDGAPPNAATVTFARRDPWQSAASTDLGTSEGVSGSPIRLALRPEHAAYPSYFVALDLDRFALELPIDVPHARSVRLEQLGRTLEAARSYEDEARGNEVFVPHHATVPLARAEKLYRSLGMTADAERVRAWSEGVTAAY